MGKPKNSSSFDGNEGNLSKEEVDYHVSCETEAPAPETHARHSSKEHNSDLTIERGNPISHSAVYFRPPDPSKISRPRSPSANDMEEMTKRPAMISDGPKPSAFYQSSYLQLGHSQQSLPAIMFGGAHRSSDQNQKLTNGRYLCRRYGTLDDLLPRSSLMCYQKSDTVIANANPYPHHNSTSFINASEILSYKWENSVPFRSSFIRPKIESSAQTLYDPLVDSFKPSDSADSEEMKISPESSPAAASNNLSGAGENSPDYNPINYSSNVKPKLAPLEEVPEVSSTNHRAARVWPGQPGNRDSAEFKIFRFALAEFIKELVKPAWKKGIISNDAHKMLVRKASDKVISSVQPHQVPNSQEAAKQYISMYKPKIEKLVEGYMEVYCKSSCPSKSKE